MKSKLISASILAATFGVLLLNSCKKDEDTTAPVVTLNGASSVEISLNTSSYSDPGATATDDNDGSVTVTSDFSSTNPNLNFVNTYTITYSATDAAGNTGTATRTIRIKNDAEDYAGTYSVVDSVNGVDEFDYAQTITVDNVVNNRVHFSKFADYAGNTTIFATKRPDGNLEITPAQTGYGIGTSHGGSCDVADHAFATEAPSEVALNGFRLRYTDDNLCNTDPALHCVAHFSK